MVTPFSTFSTTLHQFPITNANKRETITNHTPDSQTASSFRDCSKNLS